MSGEWKTIDSAPQDGTEILVFGMDAGKFPMFAAVHFEDWYEPEWITCEAGNIDFRPTHWTPLPTPPSESPAPFPPSDA